MHFATNDINQTIMSDNDDDSHLDPAPRHGGGRRQGRPNYNNNILIPIIEEILPHGAEVGV
jgi:hypothetical protein